ncbi:MAG: sulfur oxidation c-type cytochrome SoxA [Burkholderiales bacterium]|nr:sulfur oxidation c-type cytochrome SoxA [Burkholderiales bacterium]
MRLALALVAAACGVATAADWPSDNKLNGNAFLPPGLQKLQADPIGSPVALWLERGLALWSERTGTASCQGCHGAIESMKAAAPAFPRLAPGGQSLVNLEDQIVTCRGRTGHPEAKLEDEDVLALSAALHHVAKGMPISVRPAAGQEAQWQARLGHGAQLFATRIGRINLACVHCHEQSIGKQMRADVISPGNPTGFPIYRMSWQRPGSIDRRLRACYSGVQAVLPPAGAPELRDLELYLKVRANGMPLDGPSIRR